MFYSITQVHQPDTLALELPLVGVAAWISVDPEGRIVSGEDGEVKDPNFLDYKILFAKDMPKVETFFIKTHDPEGPYGAKGIRESTFIPTAPAIPNAIYDAIGKRIKELPITAERILMVEP